MNRNYEVWWLCISEGNRETGISVWCWWERKLENNLTKANLLTSIKIINAHTISPSNSISRNLSYRYIAVCAKWYIYTHIGESLQPRCDSSDWKQAPCWSQGTGWSAGWTMLALRRRGSPSTKLSLIYS